MKSRLLLLGGLLAFGLVLSVLIYRERLQPAVPPTLTSAFQVLGESVRVADRLAGRLMSIDDFDEVALGQALKEHYRAEPGPDEIYVNAVLGTVAEGHRKAFEYEVHVIDRSDPNALALPGGVIFVTRGLLDTLESEAQLAFVLAHELGHIELSHCVDMVKYQIAASKLGVRPLGEIADLAVRVMLSDSFSKTQEHEADLYAWTWLANSRYDPSASGRAFEAMLGWATDGRPGGHGYEPGPLRDYFQSHPPMEVRAQEFGNRANRWWLAHAEQSRYIGRRNLAERNALGDGKGHATEWIAR